MIASGIYKGKVYHQRYLPTQHHFSYSVCLFWLKLDELAELEQKVRLFSSTPFSLARFRRADYLGDPDEPLEKSVIKKMTALNGSPLCGDVFFLGQIRTMGCYFSPVNFYFLRNSENCYTHMLAEVSNTPWQEKHCYLVDLAQQKDQSKEFHVSPFNPMDMQYKWRVSQPGQKFGLSLDCYREKRHFRAGLNLSLNALTSLNLMRTLIRIPSMSIKTVCGIYYQALRLWLKGTPIYSHPPHRQGRK